MSVSAIYVNLPVRDLQQTQDFWSALGLSFNPQYSDDKAVCLVLQEGTMYAMLITHPMFATFTDRPIADGATTQVLVALQVDSREKVDEIVQAALANGATRYRDNADHGWMYYDSFADPDGHQWEIMFVDTTQMPA